jgi:WD40 repeat protein
MLRQCAPESTTFLPQFPQTLSIKAIDWPAILNVIEAHEGAMKSVAFSQDGKRIVSGSDDKTIRI